ncbi:Mobile element protein [Azospirillum endophyticum]
MEDAITFIRLDVHKATIAIGVASEKQGRAPRVLVTDKLKSYATAKRKLGMSGEHRQHKGLNNRAENSHQPIRRRERQRKRFEDPAQVQRFLVIHDLIANLFHFRRDHRPIADYRKARAQALQVWAEAAGAPLTA